MGRKRWSAILTLAVAAVGFGCGSTAPPAPGDDNPTPPLPAAPAPQGECTPKSCVELHATCGEITDGCGHKLTCGSCGPNQACAITAGGQSCTASSCVPRTCDEVGALCGAANDGCGGTLQCGGCPAGESCGGAGVPNHCGTAAGVIRFSQLFAQLTHPVAPHLAAGPGGVVVALGSGEGAEARLRLFSVPLDGGAPEQLASDPVSAPTDALVSLAPDGGIELLPRLSCDGGACARGSFGGAPIEGPAVVSLSAPAAFDWQHPLGPVSALSLSVDAAGSALALGADGSGAAQLVKLDASGTVIWSVSSWAQAAAFDDQGAVLLAGRAHGGGAVAGAPSDWTVDDALFVAKLSASGRPAWQRALLGCVGRMGAIAPGPSGAVVASGLIAGECHLAGATFHLPKDAPQPFVASFDAAGKPLWASLVGLSTGPDQPVLLAVGGNGQIALVSSQGAMQVLAADGSVLWSRILPGTPSAVAAHPNGDWLIAGIATGATELGAPPGSTVPQAYLVDLRP